LRRTTCPRAESSRRQNPRRSNRSTSPGRYLASTVSRARSRSIRPSVASRRAERPRPSFTERSPSSSHKPLGASFAGALSSSQRSHLPRRTPDIRCLTRTPSFGELLTATAEPPGPHTRATYRPTRNKGCSPNTRRGSPNDSRVEPQHPVLPRQPHAASAQPQVQSDPARSASRAAHRPDDHPPPQGFAGDVPPPTGHDLTTRKERKSSREAHHIGGADFFRREGGDVPAVHEKAPRTRGGMTRADERIRTADPFITSRLFAGLFGLSPVSEVRSHALRWGHIRGVRDKVRDKL